MAKEKGFDFLTGGDRKSATEATKITARMLEIAKAALKGTTRNVFVPPSETKTLLPTTSRGHPKVWCH